MSKSILVIDTPKNVEECLAKYARLFGCILLETGRCKSNDCPLRPVPKNKDEHVKLDSWELTEIINAEHRGYNNALKDILGETE